jgi:hypothetical protein
MQSMKKTLVTLTVLLAGAMLLYGAYTKLVEFNAGMQVGYNGNTVKQLIHGSATLSAGAATVSTPYVTANSRIFLTGQGATPTGFLRVSARTAGTSFVITDSVSEAGTVAWLLIEP